MDKPDESSRAELSHFDEQGNAIMVDVGEKDVTKRVAVAGGSITMSEVAYQKIREGSVAKGDVLGVARVAAIMSAKKTPDLIPLCHPLLLDRVEIDFSFQDATNTIDIFASVAISGKTGVEMEALTAVSVAALTIYDMCKAVDKSMVIGDIRLVKKTGGKSGTYST